VFKLSKNHTAYKYSAVVLKLRTVQQASPGWAIRFCKRHPELLQCIPTLDTALPGPLLQKVEKFRCEVQQTVRDNSLSLDCIGNMDELYLSFSALVSGRIILEAVKLAADCLRALNRYRHFAKPCTVMNALYLMFVSASSVYCCCVPLLLVIPLLTAETVIYDFTMIIHIVSC
jgi:hypothetical protein